MSVFLISEYHLWAIYLEVIIGLDEKAKKILVFIYGYLLKIGYGLFVRTNSGENIVGRWLVWILAILLLISAGITYRVLASGLKIVVDNSIMLPIPLNAFPTDIRDWTGKDVPIPQNIQRVAGNDDFINRVYINKANNQWANVYIAYSAQPRTMLGHKPEVCYVGGGWIYDYTQPSMVFSISGTEIPCLVHRFHRPAPETSEVVVLNFYIVNGSITNDERVFSGIGWRTPNIKGDPARYVAQIQISSVLENSVRLAAKDMTDIVLDFLPDSGGKIKAVEYSNFKNNVLK